MSCHVMSSIIISYDYRIISSQKAIIEVLKLELDKENSETVPKEDRSWKC